MDCRHRYSTTQVTVVAIARTLAKMVIFGKVDARPRTSAYRPKADTRAVYRRGSVARHELSAGALCHTYYLRVMAFKSTRFKADGSSPASTAPASATMSCGSRRIPPKLTNPRPCETNIAVV